jgi:hypothetical protein
LTRRKKPNEFEFINNIHTKHNEEVRLEDEMEEEERERINISEGTRNHIVAWCRHGMCCLGLGLQPRSEIIKAKTGHNRT